MQNYVRYYNLIYVTVPIAEIALAGYCLKRLLNPFMQNKHGTLAAGTVYSLTMLLFYFSPLPFDHFMSYWFGVFFAFLVMCLSDRKNYEQKVFLAVTFFALRGFTFSMAEILYDRIYSFAENTDYMAARPAMFFPLYIGMCLLYLLAGFVFTMTGIRCILKHYTKKQTPMSKKEVLVLMIPSLMGIVGYEIIGCYRNFYIGETGQISVFYDVLSLLYYAVAVITIVVMILLYQSIRAGQEDKLQNELLAMQLANVRHHIKKAEFYYQNIRSVRHDMANHMITLERLYARNQTAETNAYREKLFTLLEEATSQINSGNPITDVILQETRSESKKRHIRLDLDFHYPANTNVDAFDLSVILNNALQNALEYAEGDEKYVSVLSYRRDNAYMIEIGNSFHGSLQWDTQSGLPVTSKEKSNGHGYGLSNIRKVAKKYAGDIAVDLKDATFLLSILLMTESQKTDSNY